MSTIDCSVADAGVGGGGVPPTPLARRPLHRLAAVRRLQGISRRTLARRLNTDVSTVKKQEQQTADIALSTLYEWQQVLEVPLTELLVDNDEPLSGPVLKRARMVRLMKTAAAILQRSQQPSIQRMARMLVDQLIEMMPELEGVSPWHAVGRRRTQNELGQAAQRRVSSETLRACRD